MLKMKIIAWFDQVKITWTERLDIRKSLKIFSTKDFRPISTMYL